MLIYIWDDILSKLLDNSYVSSDTKCSAIEVNNISNLLMNLSKIIVRISFRYEKYLCIGDFNSKTTDTILRNFYDLHNFFGHHIYNCTCTINNLIKDRAHFFCIQLPGVGLYFHALFHKSKYCRFGALCRQQISLKKATKVKATRLGK